MNAYANEYTYNLHTTMVRCDLARNERANKSLAGGITTATHNFEQFGEEALERAKMFTAFCREYKGKGITEVRRTGLRVHIRYTIVRDA